MYEVNMAYQNKFGQQQQAPQGSLIYDPKTNQWLDANTGQVYKPPTTAKDTTWAPDIQGSFEGATQALDQYYGALKPPEQLTGLGQRIEDVGTYQGYDWQIPEGAELPQYQKFTGYDQLAMERTDFGAPEIEAIKEVSPIAEDIYGAQKTASAEGIRAQYAGLRQQIEDEVARNQTRPEQAAALLANLGIEENKAIASANSDIGYQEAQSKLGLEQKEQELGLTRSTAQEGLEQQALASQAGERQAAAQYAKDIEAAKAAEGQYAYQQDVSKSQYDTGLQTWLQEQQAAEAEKEYQSKYGQAQDLTSLQAQEWEANQAGQYDYLNALLQGQQAATGLASQAGTYMTNLPEDVQEDVMAYQQTPEYQQSSYQPQYYGANASTRTQPATKTMYQQKYSMPAKTLGSSEGFSNARQPAMNQQQLASAKQATSQQAQKTSYVPKYQNAYKTAKSQYAMPKTAQTMGAT